MDGFFTQARTNLAPHDNARPSAQRSREWLSKVRVVSTTQPLLPPKIKPGVFDAVSNALYANLWLKVDYKNAAGQQITADVMPLGLAQQGPRLYLVCRFRDYDNERSLALHRIHSATASTLPFDRPPEFDLARYDDDGRFGFGEGKKVRLSFAITKDAGLQLLECPLSADQQVKEVTATKLPQRLYRLLFWRGGCLDLGIMCGALNGHLRITTAKSTNLVCFDIWNFAKNFSNDLNIGK